jgi:hypothetical protein
MLTRRTAASVSPCFPEEEDGDEEDAEEAAPGHFLKWMCRLRLPVGA